MFVGTALVPGFFSGAIVHIVNCKKTLQIGYVNLKFFFSLCILSNEKLPLN